MKLNFANDRVLAVVAHPDDAELLCAGTLAKAKADGATVAVCVLCKGEKGQPPKRIRNLAAVRHREAEAAMRLLGSELFWGNFPDGELADDLAARRKLIEVYRRFRPTLVLAHAPEDYHPDHKAASALADAASWFCASRGQRTGGPALARAPSIWWMDTINMEGFTPGFFVDVSAHVRLKERLLQCHKSQLTRGAASDFAPLFELMQQQYTTRGSQAGVAAAEAFRAYLAFKRARAW